LRLMRAEKLGIGGVLVAVAKAFLATCFGCCSVGSLTRVFER
jgi:hypothetical protein